jgi:hypothetical protein
LLETLAITPSEAEWNKCREALKPVGKRKGRSITLRPCPWTLVVPPATVAVTMMPPAVMVAMTVIVVVVITVMVVVIIIGRGGRWVRRAEQQA